MTLNYVAALGSEAVNTLLPDMGVKHGKCLGIYLTF